MTKLLLQKKIVAYHELTGTWFWWGARNCVAGQLKVLWRFNNYYLKEVKKCRNLL